jgi:hypothetical protein
LVPCKESTEDDEISCIDGPDSIKTISSKEPILKNDFQKKEYFMKRSLNLEKSRWKLGTVEPFGTADAPDICF